MGSSVNAIRRKSLQARFAALQQEYEAVDSELLLSVDVAIKVRLERRQQALIAELEQIEQQLQALDAPPAQAQPAEQQPPLPAEGAVDRRALRDMLVSGFSVEELADLCQEVEDDLRDAGSTERLNLEIVGGEGKTSKVLNLIGYLERRGKLAYLVRAVWRSRPDSAGQLLR